MPPPSAPAAPAGVSGFDALTKDQKAQDYWFRRLIAYVIDVILVYVPLYIIFLLVAVPFLFIGGFGFYALFFGSYIFLWGIIFILYNAFMESTSGQSFGKSFLNLKVVSKSGANPSFVDAFIRNLSKIYWLLLVLDVIVGLAVSKEYSQKWTDTFLGTRVVSKTQTI